MTVSLAIFDLGNVVFRASSDLMVARWSELSGVPGAEIRRRFNLREELGKERLQALERGELTEQEFFGWLNERLELGLSLDQLIGGWNLVYGPAMERTCFAIRELAGVVPVVALTNTNDTHCPIWRKLYASELEVFRKVYVSSEMGMVKPERRIYEHVLGEWGVSGPDTVFFDDRQENVDGAAEVGIGTVLVTSDDIVPEWVRGYLRDQ